MNWPKALLPTTLWLLLCAAPGSLPTGWAGETEPIPSVSNAVLNGGFDDDLQGWALPAAGAGRDETFKYSGRASLRLEGNPDAKLSLTQYLPKLKPDTRYRLRFAIKTREIVPNRDAANYFCGVYGAAINVWAGKGKNLWFPPSGAITGTTRWTVLGFDFDTAPKEGLGNYYLRIDLDHASGIAWFDDIEIREIGSEPGPVSPR